MKIGIMETGAYGLVLAMMFSEKNNEIMMWTKFTSKKEELENTRISKRLSSDY